MMTSRFIEKLEWQVYPSRKEFTWEAAQTQPAVLGLGWRLPTKEELLAVVGRNIFSDPPHGDFWTSEKTPDSTAWCVGGLTGEASLVPLQSELFVRCVRDVT